MFVGYSFFLFVAPFLIFYCEVELERKSQLQKEKARRREAEKRKEERMKAREEGKGREKGKKEKGGKNVNKERGETESENSVQPIEIELLPRQKEGKGVEEEKAELATTEKQLTR